MREESVRGIRNDRKKLQQQLNKYKSDARNKLWLYVPYDQLSDEVGHLFKENPEDLGIVLVESKAHADRRPYHKQRLALMWSNQRHFALEQASRGVAVRYAISDSGIASVLHRITPTTGALKVMTPAERELRTELEPLVKSGDIQYVSNQFWLTNSEDLRESDPEPPWRMDSFYRSIRSKYDILMDSGRPVGGKFSFDPENRLSWKGDPPAPKLPTFTADDVTKEVVDLVNSEFAHHPGNIAVDHLPATREDARSFWQWALHECLPRFGPYEDAMSTKSTGIFHTRISSLLNLGRLTPESIVSDVLATDLPIQSKEGFVRQILGWREYVHHVHTSTEGFRTLHAMQLMHTDGGYTIWAGHPWQPHFPDDLDLRGSAISMLGSHNDLPSAWWGAPSGFACLDTVVRSVWDEGWSHHITRLMILSNIATLLDVAPRMLTDWFWAAYTDSYDWVVEPNVMAMGTFGVGELMTTKPYIAGANYINRMSDYCPTCRFDPKTNCPLTNLYWAFLTRHSDILHKNPRFRTISTSASRRSEADKIADASAHDKVLALLLEGKEVTPGG